MRRAGVVARGWPLLAALAIIGTVTGCATPNGDSQLQPVTDTSGNESEARNRARIHAELAGGYFELGNLGVALEEVNIATQADPSYATAYNVAGLVYAALKDERRAEENFQRALQLSPSDPDTNNNFGLYLCQRKREQEGIKYLMMAVQNPLYRYPERSFVNAGFCAKNGGDNAAAKDYFQRAVTIRRDQPQALHQLAEMAFGESNYAAAQGYLRRFAQTTPATADVLWLAVRVERKLGNSLAEKSYTRQLRKNFPQSKEAAALQAGRFE